jgi:hypothetical protein
MLLLHAARLKHPRDPALCDHLTEEVRWHFFPYGSQADPALDQVVDRGADAALGWWSKHGKLPYLEVYRPEGASPPAAPDARGGR